MRHDCNLHQLQLAQTPNREALQLLLPQLHFHQQLLQLKQAYCY